MVELVTIGINFLEAGELYTLRRGRVVPLDQNLLKIVIEDAAGQAAEFFFKEVVIMSPVDTGLLYSCWQLLGNTVTNDTPYLPHVSACNPWIRQAWEELQFYLKKSTLRLVLTPKPYITEC